MQTEATLAQADVSELDLVAVAVAQRMVPQVEVHRQLGLSRSEQ